VEIGLKRFINRGTCKIHLRLVAQAFQPVQMRLKVGAALMTSIFQYVFYKEYQGDNAQI
jgi:hypothetical protein